MNRERQSEAQSGWVASISGHLDAAAERMSQSEQKQYRLPLLLSCARHVAAFSPDCQECRLLQEQITRLAQSIRQPGISREEFTNYLGVIKAIIRHLRRNHRLVQERHYVKSMLAVGAALGISTVVLGLVLLNLGISILMLNVTLPALVVRLGFAFTFGRVLDRRARRRGKVI